MRERVDRGVPVEDVDQARMDFDTAGQDQLAEQRGGQPEPSHAGVQQRDTAVIAVRDAEHVIGQQRPLPF
ncbi:hypothetical protein KRMM14A1004_59940 [Krasilnikovia sp. MM14-A1004]